MKNNHAYGDHSYFGHSEISTGIPLSSNCTIYGKDWRFPYFAGRLPAPVTKAMQTSADSENLRG